MGKQCSGWSSVWRGEHANEMDCWSCMWTCHGVLRGWHWSSASLRSGIWSKMGLLAYCGTLHLSKCPVTEKISVGSILLCFQSIKHVFFDFMVCLHSFFKSLYYKLLYYCKNVQILENPSAVSSDVECRSGGQDFHASLSSYIGHLPRIISSIISSCFSSS